MYRVHQLVRVQPEHFPRRNLESYAYGQVSRVTGTHVHVHVRANNVVTEFRDSIPLATCTLPIVDVAEVESGTGLWMRRHAFCTSNETWLHGQVTAYDPVSCMVTLTTQTSDYSIPAAQLEPTFPICGAMLANQSLHASPHDADGPFTAAQIRALHDTIFTRCITGDVDLPATQDISAIMSGLVAPETLPLPDDILTFTDHATGETRRTTLQHVIDFAFVIDGENTTESHRPLGSSYCDDPSLIRALHPNPTAQPTASVTTVSFPTGPPALPPYRRQLLQPSLHIDAFLQQELPSPVSSPLVAPCIPLADGQAASQAQRVSRAAARSQVPSQTFAEAALTDGSQSTKPTKFAFNPTVTQRAVHRTLTSPTLVHLPPMELMSRLSCDPWIGFTPHPGIFTYLYDLSFGSGSLSVAHFLPLTDHERRTWNDDAAVNPRNFSASVSPPRPRSLQSAQAILDALDTLDAFFLPSAYGSPTASQYFSCAKRFCTTLNRRFPITPLSVPVVVAWLDDQFHSFGSAIATDFQYARRPSVHTQSFTTFDINGPASYQLQMCITQAYLVSQPTRTVHHNPTRHSTTTVQSDSIGQHSTAQHSRVGIPPAVRDNIPTSDGKSICLRFLSNKGCNAGPLGASCGRGPRARIHAIPTRLPSSVSSHIVTHLNGLKQEYSHLAGLRRGRDWLLPPWPFIATCSQPSASSVPHGSHPSLRQPIQSPSAPHGLDVSPRSHLAPSSPLTTSWDPPTPSTPQSIHTHGPPTAWHHSVTSCTVQAVQSALVHCVTMDRGNISAFAPVQSSLHNHACDTHQSILDTESIRQITSAAIAMQLSPADLIRLVRGESKSDPRPNKALRPDFLHYLYHDYTHGTLLVDIATHGFTGPWISPPPRRPSPPRNHGSARGNMPTLLRLLREGQDSRCYVFLSEAILPLWRDHVVFSPLGLVPKKDAPLAQTGRVIHDLSFPLGQSVNSCTNKDKLPLVERPKILHVASRINVLRASLPPNTAIKGMVGDVASAYRHLSASCTDAVWFGLAVPEAGVIGIDMSAPFGWCGSPNIYCAFGNGISWLVSRESPASLLPKLSSDHRPFWGFNYIDDHILIEQDIGYRLSCANNALRLAMMATLGPTSLNLQKFTPWSSTLTALGLTWDLSTGTVSMPLAKIAKAQLRVQSLLSGKLSTRHDLEKTLGSLRHVCSCIRPARAFYQCLHLTLRRFPRFGAHPLPPDAIADLSWFADILRVGHLSNVPTTILTGSSLPSFVLEMDASDEGLAVLFPTQRRFIRLEWDAVETALIQQCSNPRLEKMASANHKTDNSPQMASTQSQFSINVREHFCIALAIATWGPLLTDPLGLNTVHVETLTDNTSALAWSTSLVSSNSYSQELNRWLGLHQAMHQLHVSSRHIQGVLNTNPDAGSRARREPYRTIWQTATAGWTESPVAPEYRRMYQASHTSTAPHWPHHPTNATLASGKNGNRTNTPTGTRTGYLETPSSNPQLCSRSQQLSGAPQLVVKTALQQSCPKSQSSRGTIDAPSTTLYGSALPTSPKSEECCVSVLQSTPKNPCPSLSCSPFVNDYACTTATTESSGALRSWLSSFFCVAPNTQLSTTSPLTTPSGSATFHYTTNSDGQVETTTTSE